jgi:hypothetical protein
MPAESLTQRNTARMAMGYKHGSLRLADIPEGAREAVQSMAQMEEGRLQEYMHLRRPERGSLLRMRG